MILLKTIFIIHAHERNNNIEESVNIEPEKIDLPNLRDVTLDFLIRDPDERLLILSYPTSSIEIRRLYIKLGSYKIQKSKYNSILVVLTVYCAIFNKLSL